MELSQAKKMVEQILINDKALIDLRPITPSITEAPGTLIFEYKVEPESLYAAFISGITVTISIETEISNDNDYIAVTSFKYTNLNGNRLGSPGLVYVFDDRFDLIDVKK